MATHFAIVGLILPCIGASFAWAQDTPTLILSEPTFQSGETEHTWLYRVELTNVPMNTETTFMLYLHIPERTRVHEINEDGVTSTSSRLSSFTEVAIRTKTSQAVTLTVTGRSVDVKAGPAVEHQWRVGDGDRKTIHASAPEVLYDPSVIRFVFGTGLLLRRDDHIDFVVSDDKKALLVKNDSTRRATGTVGALLTVGEFRLKEVHPIDLLLSVDFTPHTNRNIDGFMFGLAVGVNKYLSVGGGYRLNLGQELSPGFRRDSVALVEELLKNDEHKNNYRKFTGLELNDELYDGFSLVDPRTGASVFRGDPVIDSYNNSWFFGVFIPLDIRDLFSARNAL